MEILYPMLFEHNFLETVWGGCKLKPLKGLAADDCKVGESWEISAVEGRESVVANGTLAGKKLTDIVEEYGEALLGKKTVEMFGRKFPLLIKFIDAAADLSIQVHPDDALAAERHGSLGKTEMWYVLGADKGAHLYSGFQKQITPSEYTARVADGSICEVLHSCEVERGDSFFIPAGRVHAICGGLLIAEIQENSDITYRIFDYNRPGLDGKLRQLHTELAKDAIDYKVYDSYKTDYECEKNKPAELAANKYFTVNVLHIDRESCRNLSVYDSFVVYMCLKGDCRIDILGGTCKELPESGSLRLPEGYSCLVPAACANVRLVPDNAAGETEVLEVYIDNKDINK
ncbi:MAG: class I mannose-6-phosphate isomerase [Bacteroides sp.]|nr:class I mannose-6-phosphate isomerase [Bacteroides sp.]MCM1420684.1 class I mannose-6-phosphate isomerase [Bacteroides sp.]